MLSNQTKARISCRKRNHSKPVSNDRDRNQAWQEADDDDDDDVKKEEDDGQFKR